MAKDLTPQEAAREARKIFREGVIVITYERGYFEIAGEFWAASSRTLRSCLAKLKKEVKA